jgi:hypothetical protein
VCEEFVVDIIEVPGALLVEAMASDILPIGSRKRRERPSKEGFHGGFLATNEGFEQCFARRGSLLDASRNIVLQ